MNQYTGGVKFAGPGDSLTAAVSSPRGNCLGFWNMENRKMLAQHYIHDVSGIAYDAQDRNFFVTTGAGAIHRFNTRGHEVSRYRTIAPNHLLATN
ncbi:MAG TPA: DUF1513 domain-containing protein [Gammaproteobacteria bacterium]|nr:DUF1513 domain-containing protein [Gammaproteobacteria bacterium]